MCGFRLWRGCVGEQKQKQKHMQNVIVSRLDPCRLLFTLFNRLSKSISTARISFSFWVLKWAWNRDETRFSTAGLLNLKKLSFPPRVVIFSLFLSHSVLVFWHSRPVYFRWYSRRFWQCLLTFSLVSVETSDAANEDSIRRRFNTILSFRRFRWRFQNLRKVFRWFWRTVGRNQENKWDIGICGETIGCGFLKSSTMFFQAIPMDENPDDFYSDSKRFRWCFLMF